MAMAIRAARLAIPSEIALEFVDSNVVDGIVCEPGGVCSAPMRATEAVLAALRPV
jgi:hypothetical protein